MVQPVRGSSSKKQGGGTSTAISTVGGSSSIIVCFIGTDSGSNPTISADSNGNTWPGSPLWSVTSSGGERNLAFVLDGTQGTPVVGSGSHTITITGGGGADIIGMVEYTGATGYEVWNGLDDTSAPPFDIPTNGSTTVADAAIVSQASGSGVAVTTTHSVTPGTKFIEEQDYATYWAFAVGDELVTTTGVKSQQWSFTPTAGTAAPMGIIAIKGTSGNTAPLLHRQFADRLPFKFRPYTRKLAKPVVTSNDVTIGLTGVSATGTIGALGVDVAPNPSGVTGTGSVGTLGVGVSPSLIGVSSTTSIGAIVYGLSKDLAGVSGTGSIGVFGVNVEPTTLTGQTATGSVGTVTATANPVVALAGVTGTGSVGSFGVNVTIGLTGVSATGSVGTITASVGGGAVTVGLAGVSATGSVGSLGVGVTVQLTGVTATGSVGTVTANGTPVGATGRSVSFYNSVTGYQGVSAWPSVAGYGSVSRDSN